MRYWGVILASLLIAFALPRCSVLISDDLGLVRCTQEGQIGSPSCEAAQICAAGRCRACVEIDVCGDGIDNDCNHLVDDRCPSSAGGNGGVEGVTAGASSG